MTHCPTPQVGFRNASPDEIRKDSLANEAIVVKWVYKVLLVRWTVFSIFIEVAKKLHAGNLPRDIKRDWLLFQILPIVLVDDHYPFLALMNSCLVGVATEALRSTLIYSRLQSLGSGI